MVGTARDCELAPGHPLPELLADSAGREVPRVHLDGMDPREVAGADRRLATTATGATAVSAIHAETGGNPFFVKQLARHLEEPGDARARRRAGCRMASAT